MASVSPDNISSTVIILICHSFCAFIAKDADKYLESIQGPNALSIIFNFFDWSLSQKVGKDGRRKRGIKKSSSLGTYWKVFRLVFERATGNKLDALMNRKMHRVRRFLVKQKKKSTNSIGATESR